MGIKDRATWLPTLTNGARAGSMTTPHLPSTRRFTHERRQQRSWRRRPFNDRERLRCDTYSAHTVTVPSARRPGLLRLDRVEWPIPIMHTGQQHLRRAPCLHGGPLMDRHRKRSVAIEAFSSVDNHHGDIGDEDIPSDVGCMQLNGLFVG